MAKYQGFFEKAWKQAGVDEKTYQAKIRAVFPGQIAERIQFAPFLGFSIVVEPEKASSAPPPPPRDFICIKDACAKAAGEVKGSSYLISGGGGNYGQCFVNARSWSAVAAFGEISSTLKDPFSIPGDMPQDSRRLSVTFDYDLKLEATSFAILGTGLATAAVSNRYASNTDQLMVFAPVIFANSRILKKTVHDNYIIEKTQLSQCRISAGSTVMSAVISGSWGNAEANNIRWSVCEIK
jgi:hypothetical protein